MHTTRETSNDGQLPERTVWARMCTPLPDDPVIHAAAIAYLSDSGPMATVTHHYGIRGNGWQTASLDHAIWFHSRPRFDDWLLYASESTVAGSSRALILARMYDRRGDHVVSVAQEGLFRRPRSEIVLR